MKDYQLPERNGYCFVPWKHHTLRMWMWFCSEEKCRRKEEDLLMCAVYTVVANNPTASVVPLHK